MRWLLLGVALLAGCGPSALEKAKTKLELQEAELAEVQAKIADYQKQADQFDNNESINKSMLEWRDIAAEYKRQLDETRAEVRRLSE